MNNFNQITICPQCLKYPFISFSVTNPKLVSIKCNYCGYNKNITISTYIDYITKEGNVNIDYNDENDYYCKNCNLHIPDYFGMYEHHKKHVLISLKKTIPIDNLYKTLTDLYNYINYNCEEIKKKTINEYKFKIIELEKSYKSFKIINNDILNLLFQITHTYHKKSRNYYLQCNLINAFHVNTKKYNNDSHIESLINYFNNFTLISSLVDLPDINITKSINNHQSSVYSLLLLSDGRLASCSYDKTINIYNMKKNYHCDLTLIGHTWGVVSIDQLDNGKLISCSGFTIKIWSIYEKSYVCECTLKDTANQVTQKVLSLPGSKFASCSTDKNVKIWNGNPPYNLIKILDGHIAALESLLCIKRKNKLLSGGKDNTLRIWNISTYQCQTIIMKVECFSQNSMIELENNKIFIGGKNKIAIIDLNKCIIEQKIENETKVDHVSSSIYLKEGIILFGTRFGIINIYDIRNKTITKIKTTLIGDIRCFLKINENQFITGSIDSVIRLWEY